MQQSLKTEATMKLKHEVIKIKSILIAMVMMVMLVGAVSAQEMTCIEAKNAGFLYATIDAGAGQAVVTNELDQDFEVGFAVYQKYDSNIHSQTIFDYDTATAGPGETILNVDVPECRSQLDVFCGEPIMEFTPNNYYGGRLIAYTDSHYTQPYCLPDNEVPEFGLVGAALAIGMAATFILIKRRK